VPDKRRDDRKRVASMPRRRPRQAAWAALSEKDRQIARAAAEDDNRRAEASVSLVRLRPAPGQGPEDLGRECSVLLGKLRALLKKAADQGRDLSAEEASEWDLMEVEFVAGKAGISMHAEIDRLSSALRDPLHLIDSTRWRCSSDAVQRKIAEELYNVFVLEIRHARRWYDGVRNLQTERDAYLKAAKILGKTPPVSRDAEAVFGFHHGLPTPVDLKHHALLLNRRVNWFLQFHQRPLFRHTPRLLDGLTLRLAAILAHTTDLSTHYILREVLPSVLDTAWRFYPDLAPQRGAADPLTRHKRNIRSRMQDAARPMEQRTYLDPRAMIKLADNRFMEYRELLFKNDSRFPDLLFRLHRPIRTVTHKAPSRPR